MSKYVKIFNEQGLPLGFKDADELSDKLGDARVKLYDEKQRLLGFRVGGGEPTSPLVSICSADVGPNGITDNVCITQFSGGSIQHNSSYLYIVVHTNQPVTDADIVSETKHQIAEGQAVFSYDNREIPVTISGSVLGAAFDVTITE